MLWLTNDKIAKAVDDEVVTRDLVPAFVKLLKDSEAEVRTAIAGQIPGFCNLIDRTTLLNDIMTSVEDLVSDSSQHVRAALGTQISGLAPILGKQEYVPLSSIFYSVLTALELLIIFFLCSFRCSRMSSQTSAFTLSPSSNWSTKVLNSNFLHEIY